MPKDRAGCERLMNELADVPRISGIDLKARGHPAALVGQGVLKRIVHSGVYKECEESTSTLIGDGGMAMCEVTPCVKILLL